MSKHFGRSVSIIGAGYSHMGVAGVTPELKDFSEREMAAAAAIEAMEDAGIEAKSIDAFTYGQCGPNFYGKAMCCAPHYADWFGMHGKPGWAHDEGCATSLFGVNQAIMMVASGVYDCVISVNNGFNTTCPVPTRPPHLRTNLDNDLFWEGCYYSVEPAFDKPGNAGVGNAEALILCYLKKYGYSFKNYDEAMSTYLQIQRKQALTNPKSHLFPLSFEEEAKNMGFDSVDEYILNDIFNPKVGTLLRGKYLGQAVDGAAAVIVCASDLAAKISNKKPIEVIGMGNASNVVRDWGHYPIDAEVNCVKQTLSMAGISDPSKEIQYAAVHDCTGGSLFTSTELFGYFEPGQAMRAVIEGKIGFDGSHPINTSGGRLQLGHPSAGAMGIELTEMVRQMRGENGPRQMANVPKTGMAVGFGAGFNIASLALKCR